MKATRPTALAFVATATSSAAVEECPVWLVLKSEGISATEAKLADKYALRMRHPSLPTTEHLVERLENCARVRPASPSEKLTEAFDWIDKMATNLPDCETSLTTEMK